MEMMKNTKKGSVYAFLDARTPMTNSDLLPVKISVSLKGKQFRMGLKLYATKELFGKAMAGYGSISNEAKVLKKQIDNYLNKATNILDRFPNADKKLFSNLFKSESALMVSNKTDMEILFQQKIDELIKEDRAGSLFFYEQGLSTFKAYDKSFYLEDIDPTWLSGFKAYWINKGNSIASAQIHMRSLRHIFNRAIKQGLIAQSLYPFNDFKIGTASRSKDVLYPEQLKQLWEYEPTARGEQRSKDYFFFFYLCNGMNIKDALNLKGTNLKRDSIRFVRSKTANTSSEIREIIVHLHPEAKRIIEKWGSLNTKDYIFPCLRESKTNIERKHTKDIFARNLNRDLRTIGEKLKLDVNLTLNLARHSLATRMKLEGVSVSIISEFLGHSNTATTQHYLKTVPDSMRKDISDNLLNFG